MNDLLGFETLEHAIIEVAIFVCLKQKKKKKKKKKQPKEVHSYPSAYDIEQKT